MVSGSLGSRLVLVPVDLGSGSDRRDRDCGDKDAGSEARVRLVA